MPTEVAEKVLRVFLMTNSYVAELAKRFTGNCYIVVRLATSFALLQLRLIGGAVEQPALL